MYHHRIWYFPVMGGVKRGGVGGRLHVSKERGDIKQGEMKKERGADTTFRTMRSSCLKLDQVSYLFGKPGQVNFPTF